MTNYGYAQGGLTATDPGHEVELNSGEKVKLQSEAEQRWFNDTKTKYRSETKFDQSTDLQDLDRLLMLELLLFRWNQHLASGFDYHGNVVDDDLLRKQINDQSKSITAVKASLGMDKKTRDAALNEGNFATWFTDVKRRAKIFGLHRENQLNVALALMNELSGIVGAYDRSDEDERKKLGYETPEQIVAWVREEMLPKFHKVDQHFLEHEQKLWKRDL